MQVRAAGVAARRFGGSGSKTLFSNSSASRLGGENLSTDYAMRPGWRNSGPVFAILKLNP
jgi:hypothetical protein